eukprot:TRINITY_DN29131_c0_g1_i1.p1 TRINITY_DN29131_c0_g1~~TRINITY_DN29131_c0_g1_i1.p1  ORF type:complete len:291 (+),score=70.94 TRINITY_DN29131_c0_g1_i1:65-874(+)
MTELRTTSKFIMLEGDCPAILVTPSAEVEVQMMFVWLHGNAMTADDCEEICQVMADANNAGAVIPEYPGYGMYKQRHRWSGANPDGINKVARVAYEYIRDVMRCDPSRIVVVGHSIGTGPAVRLASHVGCGGLVLISPFTSLSRIIEHVIAYHLPLQRCASCLGACVRPCSGWTPISDILNVSCPILLVHGTQDTLISFENSLELLLASSPTAALQDIRYDKLTQYDRTWLRLSTKADHVNWHRERDITRPTTEFIKAAVVMKGKAPVV